MAKYDRIKDPIRKAMEFNEISFGVEKGTESALKSMDKQRQFNQSLDKNLLEFGMSLYENGYTLDDVRTDLELCKAARDINPDYDQEKSMMEYKGISNAPSYKKMLTIVDNPNLFRPIENGFNIAYRRNLAKELDQKYGMSR